MLEEFCRTPTQPVGVVLSRSITFQCAGVWISTGLPCTVQTDILDLTCTIYIYIYSLQLAYNSTGVGSTGTQLGVVLEHVSKKMFKYLQEIKRFLVTSAEAYQFCCDCSSVTTLQFKYMRQR